MSNPGDCQRCPKPAMLGRTLCAECTALYRKVIEQGPLHAMRNTRPRRPTRCRGCGADLPRLESGRRGSCAFCGPNPLRSSEDF